MIENLTVKTKLKYYTETSCMTRRWTDAQLKQKVEKKQQQMQHRQNTLCTNYIHLYTKQKRSGIVYIIEISRLKVKRQLAEKRNRPTVTTSDATPSPYQASSKVDKQDISLKKLERPGHKR